LETLAGSSVGFSGLALAANGTLYVNFCSAGSYGMGSVCQLTASGLTTLYSFDGADGATPLAALV
jgi:hypothetical protein